MDKTSKIKLTIFSLFIFLLSILLIQAITYESRTPADLSYHLNYSGNLTFIFNVTILASSGEGYNITNMSLYTDNFFGNGSYYVNQTKNLNTDNLNRSTRIDNFSIFIPADGKTLKWYIEVWTENETGSNGARNITYNFNTTVRTIYIERPPITYMKSPTDNSWSTTKGFYINWTTNSSYTTEVNLQCKIFTNSSGSWSSDPTSTFVCQNNTMYRHYYTANLDINNLLIGVKAYESNANIFRFSDTNLTIHIDSANPSISIIAPTAQEFKNSATVNITFSITDNNSDSVVIWLKKGTGDWIKNVTNRTSISGVYDNQLSLSDSSYQVYFWGNDSAGNLVNTSSSAVNFTVDTISPGVVSYKNESAGAYALNWSFVVAASEKVNLTLNYGITTLLGTLVHQSTVNNSHRLYIPFSKDNTETIHYNNITICDRAANCNRSWSDETGGLRYETPAPLYTGWTQYVQLEAKTLDRISNDSGADFVYVWQPLIQSWAYHTAGAKTQNFSYIAPYGSILHLYENVNSTWQRNRANLTSYNHTVYSGHNWIGVVYNYNFFNLTLNDTGQQGQLRAMEGLNTSIEFYGGYNISRQRYENHIFNWTWGNLTALNLKKVESIWMYSNINVTLNLNSTGVYMAGGYP